jgi:hypothetical protein
MRIYAGEDFGEDDHKEQQLFVHCGLICVFNLALANHAQAIRTPEKGAALCLFEKVSRLYELSHTLWLQQGDLNHEIFIVLAILNNLGMIHKHCQRTVQGRQCLELLLSVLIFLKDSESVRQQWQFGWLLLEHRQRARCSQTNHQRTFCMRMRSTQY